MNCQFLDASARVIKLNLFGIDVPVWGASKHTVPVYRSTTGCQSYIGGSHCGAVMSFASSAVTYTSVYTNSKPGRVFWGANEEISDGGIPTRHTLLDTGIPMRQPPHDPEYAAIAFVVPEGYVVELDLEEDPEEYEDDETEDGPVNYPLDGGDDGDDDDGDSSGDDADDKDEDDEDEEEEEEEHLALADSPIVVPTIEPVSLPGGTEPVIPPPSIDISTTGARITIQLQASISLPPKAEVERLLAMTTPSPSPPISLSPPSAGERLARCTTPPAHSSPPPVPSPLLLSSGMTLQETVWVVNEEAYASLEVWAHSIGLSQVKMAALRESDRRCEAQMAESLRVMRDLRREMSDMQTELLAHREQQRRARLPGPDARIPDHQDASGDADSHI
ncbi:hypothetical protein Tco_0455713 [Tanacetum coccineum]